MRFGRFCCRLYVGLHGTRTAIGDVLSNGAMKQEYVLAYQPKGSAQIRYLEFGQVGSIES